MMIKIKRRLPDYLELVPPPEAPPAPASVQVPAPDAHEDARLNQLYAAGDAAAFAELFERFQRPLYAFLCGFVGDRELAADLTQDAFVSAWRGRDRFRPDARFRPWLFRIARNAALDHLKSSGHARRSSQPPPERACTDNPERAAQRRHRLAVVEAAIARLPPDYREALVLHTIVGMGYAAISDVTGATVATLKIRVVRARARLRDLIAEAGHDE